MENSIITIKDTETGKEVICPESFDITTVTESKVILEQLLQEAPAEILLTTETIQSVDTSAIQLLNSFIKSIQEKEINFKVGSHSEAFLEVAEVLGLTKTFSV